MKQILFNTEMVKAILDGRKTVTRRCAKFVRREEFPNVNLYCSACEVDKLGSTAYCIYQKMNGCWNEMTLPLKPKYAIGDILYVRETYKKYTKRVGTCDNIHFREFIAYKADLNLFVPSEFYDDNWKPSIHMPKEAARIFLRVTDVRIERLQDITEEQAIKEGLHEYTKDGVVVKYAVNETAFAWSEMPRTATEAFYHLWNSTLKQDELDQYGWDANPYVFVYEFEVISKEEAYLEGEKL